jgi:hypothetical protein
LKFNERGEKVKRLLLFFVCKVVKECPSEKPIEFIFFIGGYYKQKPSGLS